MAIRVTLLYFGQARDSSGVGEETFLVPEGSRVLDLVSRARIKHPNLGRMKDSAKLALNEEITTDEATLHEGDSVAFLPPVAGG